MVSFSISCRDKDKWCQIHPCTDITNSPQILSVIKLLDTLNFDMLVCFEKYFNNKEISVALKFVFYNEFYYQCLNENKARTSRKRLEDFTI